MCGISGIIEQQSERTRPDQPVIERMTRSLCHRGPDRHAVWTGGPAQLGHARLSIIDLSPAGNQPMISADGRWVMVFNGEIYNFRELKAELESEGVQFKGSSDSEVLLQGIIRWGTAVIPRLNGIFAFAVWNVAEQRLIMARDRFGVKPLYYGVFPGGLAFGSEIKALLASGRFTREVDPAALHEFLFFGGGGLGSRTLFAQIRKLEAAHILIFDGKGSTTQRYWKAEEVAAVADDLETATARVRTLLEAAVKRQLVSDVPVAIFLSGGIDSSAVTALATRHYNDRLKTYSVGFDFDRGVNELPRAARIARHFGTDHHELHIKGGDLGKVLEQLIRHHDEPFSDAANIPLYLLCRELGGKTKVVLQGDGGDEVFAGYRRYNILSNWRYFRLIPRSAAALLPSKGGRWQRAARMLRILGQTEPGERMAYLLTEEPPDSAPTRILGEAWRARVECCPSFERYRLMARRFEAYDRVQQMLLTDTKILLPDIFLEKVDRATMAYGIEARVPFLDHELTDYVLGLPSGYKVRAGQKKYLLRRALRGIVPDEVLDGPKTGFGVPYQHWLRTSLAGMAREVMLDGSAAASGLVDRGTVERLLQEDKTGKAEHGFLLWKTFNLSLWHQIYQPTG